MAIKSNLVNLDAMIRREDFAASDTGSSFSENISTISLRDFTPGGLIGPILRKPDFQRETNHWKPEQVVSLLECFVNGDLIPSVILWQSPTYLFVIDGGHRLSVLKAWIEDDYGDGPISQPFFGYKIPSDQKKNAEKVRELVNRQIGSWQHLQRSNPDPLLSPEQRTRITATFSRGLPIQWVKGDADKAESSFFKINTKGTPLDEIEELLLKQRKKPIAIAARAIIRAGKGHRYWSSFATIQADQIESLSQRIHSLLFDPEISRPIKTLDLPLGGPKGVRTALQALIDLALIATRDQAGNPKTVEETIDDSAGTATMDVLNKILGLGKRVTGNDGGSLGLHPAVYFYGPTGRHSGPFFMGTMTLVGKKLSNNDRTFFKKFTKVRGNLESLLVDHKDLIALLVQKHLGPKRVGAYAVFLDGLIDHLNNQYATSEEDLVRLAGLEGKIFFGTNQAGGREFSDDTKSRVFITTALAPAPKCPICSGYLDPEKSVSYDHIIQARIGGNGSVENLQLTHPYCNQSVKQ